MFLIVIGAPVALIITPALLRSNVTTHLDQNTRLGHTRAKAERMIEKKVLQVTNVVAKIECTNSNETLPCLCYAIQKRLILAQRKRENGSTAGVPRAGCDNQSQQHALSRCSTKHCVCAHNRHVMCW